MRHCRHRKKPKIEVQTVVVALRFSLSSEGGHVQILSEGQTIRHEQYGTGIVTESNTDRTTIDFDDHGVKKFVTSIWSAEVIGEAPSGRPGRRRSRRKPARKA
jgi:hypothetical protein